MQRFGDDLNTPLEERGIAPYQWKLPFEDTVQAQFEQAVDEGTFPTLYRAYELEAGSQAGFQPASELFEASQGKPAKKGDSRERISIEQAEQEFPGLKIAPFFATNTTRGYARYLYQRQLKNQVRDMKAAQGSPVTGFVTGFGASLVDPVDLALNLTLSGVGAAKYASTAIKAGRLPSYSAAQRYFQRYQPRSILNNGIVSGAIEGFAGAAATEPIYQASKLSTEGRLDLAQSAASLALSPLVGGVVGGLSDYLTRIPVANRKDAPNPSLYERNHLETRATILAAEGESPNSAASIDVPRQRKELDDAEKEVTSKLEELANYSGGPKPPLSTATPAVEQAPVPVAATPAVEQVVGPFVLPAGLSRSAPRYGYRDKNFSLQFANDFDRAAYILASDNVAASKAAPKFREALQKAGYDPAEVARYGKTVRAGIKPLAASSEPGTLTLPDFGGLPRKSSKPAVEQAVKEPVNVAPGFPVAGGKITSGFGKRKRPTAGASVDHKGIDLAAKEGSPIVPHIGGTVVAVKSPKQSGGYGNQVIIQQDDGYIVSYAHNKKNLVKPGQKIKPGTAIAEVGSTGKSTGPHTHIEVIGPDGKLVDPAQYFGKPAKKGKGGKKVPTAPEEVDPTVRPGEVDTALSHPRQQDFMTPAEQDLNSAPVKQVKVIAEDYVGRLQEAILEYKNQPRRKGYRDEARNESLYLHMKELIDSFNETVPVSQRVQLPTLDKGSQMISPKNLDRLTASLEAFSPETVFDAAGQYNTKNIAELQALYDAKNKELKKAYAGSENPRYSEEVRKRNREMVAELAPEVDAAYLQLRQLGATDLPPDSVSVGIFREQLGKEAPGLAALLQDYDDPTPYYRVKAQLLENQRERIRAARELVENAETAPKVKNIHSIITDGYDEAVQRLETDDKITDVLATQQEQLGELQKQWDQMAQFNMIKESDAEYLKTRLKEPVELSDSDIETAVRQVGIFCQNEKGG